MAESSRLIAFDQKVTGPGKAVTDRNPEQRPNVMRSRNGPDEDGQSQQRPTSMKQSVPCARMLLQVEGEEFIVGSKPILG